jgi:precorrin-6B methylase 2
MVSSFTKSFNFISNSNIPGDPGRIQSCDGKMYISSFAMQKLIICSNGNNTYSSEFDYKATSIPLFVPATIANRTNLFPGTVADPIRESQVMYATVPMRISGFLAYGTVAAVSKQGPYILYYTYLNNNIEFSIYNWYSKTTTKILQQSLDNINNINNCSFEIGAFASKIQQDILIACNSLSLNNAFYLAENYYQKSDFGISNFCTGPIKIGDFNGDKISDILCVTTGIAMINKIGSFVSINLIKNMPGNWATQIENNNFAVGDFDGDGLYDLVSLTTNYKPEILFRTSLNRFISRSNNEDGSFTFNNLNTWCSANTTGVQFQTEDLDNDGKDDVLCKNNNEIYLALSRSTFTENNIRTVTIQLEDFVIGSNIEYSLIKNTAPVICDASKLREPETHISCSLSSLNKINSFTLPVNPSVTLPNLKVNAEISNSIVLDNTYGSLNLNLDHLPVANDKFPKSKLWKLDNINYNDPSRTFNVLSDIAYIYQFQAKNINNNLVEQRYGYRTPGGECYQIDFNHIVLSNKFTAKGIMQAYDNSNNTITDLGLLQDIASLYINNINVVNIANGQVSFTYSGQMELMTMFQKNVTYCSNSQPSGSTSINTNRQDPPYPNVLCSLPAYLSNKKTGEVKINRNDTAQLRGFIYEGPMFYPNMTGVSEWSNYSTSIDDTAVTMNFGDIQLKAYVIKYSNDPKNELRIQFFRDNQIIHEPSGQNSLYAAFSDIKLLKIAAFNVKQALLAWSIFSPEKQQYYILVDYVNTGNELLRVASFDQYFTLLIPSKRYGDEFFIAYKTDIDKIAVSKYNSGDFSPSAAIVINTSPATDTEFKVSENNENIQLVLTHGNNMGIFVYTYDIFLNLIDSSNIICQTNNIDPQTQKSEAYQTLRLNYKHDSKLINASGDQKVIIQNALNYINNGVRLLETMSMSSKVENCLSSLLCETNMSPRYLKPLIANIKSTMQSNLTFVLSDSNNNNCQTDNSIYPAFRVNQTIYLCPGYDQTSSQKDCANLLDLTSYSRNLIDQGTVAKPETLKLYLPSYSDAIINGIVQKATGNLVSESDSAAICNIGGTVTSVQSVARNVMAGLLSDSIQQPQLSSSDCNSMAIRLCNIQGDVAVNTICITNFFQAASLAYILTQSSDSNIDATQNCQVGCNLGDTALNNLLGAIGGYLTTTIDKISLFPFAISEIQPQDSNINITIPNSLLSTAKNVITSVPMYFPQFNGTMISLATLGNDYIALTTQYFMVNNTQLTKEFEIGRFINLGMFKIASFNESALLFAYTVKQPGATNYNLLVEYLSPTISQVLNIISSYSASFDIDIVPKADTTDFVVAYASSNNILNSRRYSITGHKIEQKLLVTTQIDISASPKLEISINAFNTNTFNLIWSYLNSNGINTQRYSLVDGSPIGSTQNIASQPEIIRVGADNVDKTIIAWQTSNSLFMQQMTQNLAQNFNILSFKSGNYSLMQARILDGPLSTVAIDLIDNNNQTKTVVLDTTSNKLQNINFVANSNNIASIANSAKLDSIDNNNADAYPKEGSLGKIDNIQVDAPQCDINNPNNQNILEQYQSLLKDRPNIIKKLQSLLSNTKLLESLKNQGISQETIYSVVNQANSLEGLAASLKNNNPPINLDFNLIPNRQVTIPPAIQSALENIMNSGSGSGSASGDSVSPEEFLLNLITPLLQEVGLGDLVSVLRTILEFKDRLTPPATTDDEVMIQFIAVNFKDSLIELIETVVPPIYDGITNALPLIMGKINELTNMFE